MSTNNTTTTTELTQDQKEFFYTSVKEIKDDLQRMGYTISSKDLQVAFLYGPYSKAFRKMISWFSRKISNLRKDRDIEVIEASDNITLFIKQFRKFLKDVGCSYSFLKSGDIIMNIKTFGEMYMLIDFLSVQLKMAILMQRQNQSNQTENGGKPPESSKNVGVKEEPRNATSELTKECIKTVNNAFSESEMKQFTNLFKQTYEDYRAWRGELIKDLDDTITTLAQCDIVKARNGKILSKIMKRRRMISATPDVKITDVMIAASIIKTVMKISKDSATSEGSIQDNKCEVDTVADHNPGQSSEITVVRVKEQTSEIDDGENKCEMIKIEENEAEICEIGKTYGTSELESYEFSKRSQSVEDQKCDVSLENYLMAKGYDKNKKEQNTNEKWLQKPSSHEQTLGREGATGSHSCESQDGERDEYKRQCGHREEYEKSQDVHEDQDHMSKKCRDYDRVSKSLRSIKYENISTIYERLGSKLSKATKPEQHLGLGIIDGARMQGRVGSLTYNGFPTQGRVETSENEGLLVIKGEDTIDGNVFGGERSRVIVKDRSLMQENCDIPSIERQLISMMYDESNPSKGSQELHEYELKTDKNIGVHRLVEHYSDGDNLIIKRFDISRDAGDISGRVGENNESSERSFKNQNTKNYEGVLIDKGIEFPLREESPVVGYSDGIMKPDKHKTEYDDNSPCRKKIKKRNENNKSKHIHLEHISDEIIDGGEPKRVSNNVIKGLLEEVVEPPIDSFFDASSDVDYRRTAHDMDYRTIFPADNPWSTYNRGYPRFLPENIISKNYRGIDKMLEERQIWDQEARRSRGELGE